MLTYAQLSKDLNLSPKLSDELELNKLRQWCAENLFEGINPFGNFEPQDEYQLLQNSAEDYLDVFFPESSAPNTPSEKLGGYTPIEYAAFRGYTSFLVEHLNTINPNNGRTPLHLVASLGKGDAVRTLLNAGALNIADKEGLFPIFLALCLTANEKFPSDEEQSIIKRTEIFHLLKEKNKEAITQLTQQKQNIAHYMAMYGFNLLLEELSKEHSEFFSQEDSFGRLPAHYAILNKQPACLDILLADPKVIRFGNFQGTLLHCAAKEGKRQDVIICLKAGVPSDKKDSVGRTAAMSAIFYGNVSALSGFNIEKLSEERIGENQETLLHYAIRQAKPFCIDWLTENTELSSIPDKDGTYPNEIQTVLDNDASIRIAPN